MNQQIPAADSWIRSSRCVPHGNCVEVSRGVAGLVAVRDSKGVATEFLAFGHRQWSEFLASR